MLHARTAQALIFSVILLSSSEASAQLKASPYANGLSQPLEFVQDPLSPHVQYVVEKTGAIRVVIDGQVQETPFLDLSDQISSESERGLLGLAFAPDYASSGRFFVNFTDINGDTVVARFVRSDNPLVADPGSRFDLRWGGPDGQRIIVQPAANHNGGHLAFGPDGYLYIGMGDGGGGGDPENYAQNPDSLLGKMLRIDVNVGDENEDGYVVPGDNPFLDGSALPEIWAFGFRNPWKFSFDTGGPAGPGSNGMIIGDVGQSAWEEIDFEPFGAGGRNYGWRRFEGFHDYEPETGMGPGPLAFPIFEYDRDSGHSITGGFVYRGTALGSQYVGRYFYADFIFRRVWSIALIYDQNGEAVAQDLREHTEDLSMPPGNITSMGVDAAGELYLVFYGGEVWKIGKDAPGPGPGEPASFTLTIAVSGNGSVFAPGIACGVQGSACATSLPQGLTLGLDVAPAADSQFLSWSGDADCADGVVTMTAARNCQANFSGGGGPPPPPPPPSGSARLTITKPTGGTVLGPGLECGTQGNACIGDFPAGIVIGLEIATDAGSTFTGWSAECPNGVVTLTANRTCSPTFSGGGGPPPPPPPPPPSGLARLTVTKPTGGTIFGPGITCGTQGNACIVDYPAGVVLGLEQAADAGSSFTGWSAQCPNGIVTLTADRTCAPTFSGSGPPPPPPPPPSGERQLTIIATAGGSVLGPALACGDAGGSCTVNFPAGIQIGLDIVVSPGFTFLGWSGAGCGPVVTLDVNRTCTATFGPGAPESEN